MPAGRDGGGTDVVHLSLVVVEPEQERRDPRRLLLPAQPDDHRVGGLVRLHLQDGFARAGEIGHTEALRDHPV